MYTEFRCARNIAPGVQLKKSRGINRFILILSIVNKVYCASKNELQFFSHIFFNAGDIIHVRESGKWLDFPGDSLKKREDWHL